MYISPINGWKPTGKITKITFIDLKIESIFWVISDYGGYGTLGFLSLLKFRESNPGLAVWKSVTLPIIPLRCLLRNLLFS